MQTPVGFSLFIFTFSAVLKWARKQKRATHSGSIFCELLRLCKISFQYTLNDEVQPSEWLIHRKGGDVKEIVELFRKKKKNTGCRCIVISAQPGEITIIAFVFYFHFNLD
jgi:hypothetical protein